MTGKIKVMGLRFNAVEVSLAFRSFLSSIFVFAQFFFGVENNVLRTRFTVVRFAVAVDIRVFHLHPFVCSRAAGVVPAAFSLRLHNVISLK